MKEKIQYICLAKSIPEFDKRDGKLYTCSLGFSPQKGVIRLYPLPINGLSKWDIVTLYVERNKRDSRNESWKISSGSRHENFIGFENDIQYNGKANHVQRKNIIAFLNQNASPSLSELNKNRKSIGIIKADSVHASWAENSRYKNENQITLFEDVESKNYYDRYTKDSKEKISRIAFKDGDGLHDLQLNEWHYFEGGRKLGFTKDIFKNLHTNTSKILLLGNMLQYQTSWMVLSVFGSPKVINHNLFGMVS